MTAAANGYFLHEYERDLFLGRYKDPGGQEETWEEVFGRVGNAIGRTASQRFAFTEMMMTAVAIPSSPQLWNYGSSRHTPWQGSSCFTGRLGDSIPDFLQCDADAHSIYMASGGLGLLADEVRPRGCKIAYSKSRSVGAMGVGGPVHKIEKTTGYITNGGRDRGALMVQMGARHPDFVEFILSKVVTSQGFLDDWPDNARAQMGYRLDDTSIDGYGDGNFEGVESIIKEYAATFAFDKEWPSMDAVLARSICTHADVGRMVGVGILRLDDFGRLVPYVFDYYQGEAGGWVEANKEWNLPMQNCNISGRCPDSMYHAAERGGNWIFSWFSKEDAPVGTEPWVLTDAVDGTMREYDSGYVVGAEYTNTSVSAQVHESHSASGRRPKYSVVITTWEGLKENLRPNPKNWKDVEHARFYRKVLMPWLAGYRGVIKAQQVLDLTYKAAHYCGDPGLINEDVYEQFCPVDTDLYGPRFSNPCCLVGDTYVDTDEGRIKIQDLAERFDAGKPMPNALCWDRATDTPSIRPITHAWMSGTGIEVYEMTTDGGLSITGTNHHSFLTKAGEYCELSLLPFGMGLRLSKDAPDREPHRVSTIRRLHHKADVYNITVEELHNFGVSDSPDPAADAVIVKNSEYVNPAGGSCDLISGNLRLCADAVTTATLVASLPQYNVAGISTLDDWLTLRASIEFEEYLTNIRNTSALAFEYIAEAMEKNIAPVEYIHRMSLEVFRTVGVGIMGLAEAMMRFHVPYGSEAGKYFAAATQAEVYLTCWEGSFDLVRQDPHLWRKPEGWHQARMSNIFQARLAYCLDYQLSTDHMNRMLDLLDAVEMGQYATHTTVTSIAPTGSISQIAGWQMTRAVSNGIIHDRSVTSGGEPPFSWVVGRKDNSGDVIVTHDLWQQPEHYMKPWMITANEVSASAHVEMQAALCAFTCMSVSKTINLPETATVTDVRDAYMLAWKLGVPGTAVYRNNSKPVQVLVEIKGCPGGECEVVYTSPEEAPAAK